MTRQKKLIVAITGASGSIFGIRLLEELQKVDVETHLLMSAWGARTARLETELSAKEIQNKASHVHKVNDLGATVSSGSFSVDGMIIAPCSMNTLASIANGMTTELISRSADVCLKENKPVLLMVRESPLNQIHLTNMLKAQQAGCMIMPPVPAFYNHPKSLEDLIDHTVMRTLDQFGITTTLRERWDGM